MKQKIKITTLMLVMITITLFISGCDMLQSDDPETPLTDKDFRAGDDGLLLKFLDGAPPKNVFEDANFKINAEIRNKGAYDADPAYITVNIERDYVYILDRDGNAVEYKPKQEIQAGTGDVAEVEANLNPEITKKIIVPGRSLATPDGGFEIVEFQAKAKDVGAQTTKHPTHIIISSCYNYKTILEDTLCLDPDIYSTSPVDKVCEIKEKTYSDQGSPVAITNIKPFVAELGEREASYSFDIYVKNKGVGTIIDKMKTLDACTSASVDRSNWNVVYIDKIKIGNNEFDKSKSDDQNTINCTKTRAKLSFNEGKFSCRIKGPFMMDSPAFQTQLYVELSFGYLESISTKTDIERR